MSIGKISAGSLESNDAMVLLEPSPQGVRIEIESSVKAQFGDQIEATAQAMIQHFGLENVLVQIRDRGAYDCTLRARLETAIRRYQEGCHAEA